MSNVENKEYRLTPTQASCLQLRALGHSRAQVSATMGVTCKTIQRWDKKFKGYICELPEVKVITDRMQAMLGLSSNSYEAVLRDPEASHRDKLVAARDILSNFGALIPQSKDGSTTNITIIERARKLEEGLTRLGFALKED